VKNLASDFRNIPVYITTYQDIFHALPGDDPYASTHLPGAINATTPTNMRGNGMIDGAWNSTIPTDESFLFWQDVRLANLAQGSTNVTDPTYLPTNAMGGRIGIQSNSATASPIQGLQGIYVICSYGIPGKFAIQLDTILDDGNTATGKMLVTPTVGYTLGASAITTSAIDPETSYVVCMGV
jgi:hypothetical protein